MTHADPSAPHLSVMALEVLDALGLGPDAPHAEDGVFIDGTFGAGGYSRAMLQAGAGHLYGIDRDPSARSHAAPLQDSHPERFTFVAGRFGDMVALMDAQGLGQGSIAGIALDLGVSSMQLDQAERGFSFRQDGPLDMRMSATPAQDDAANKAAGQSAADLVNTLGEEDLANILYRLGEERQSRRIARAIVARRTEQPFETTKDLAQVIRSAMRISKKAGRDSIDPATRSFQALRLAVNDELGELERGLEGAEYLLRPGGRLAVVSFHSLEDRIIKIFLKERSGKGGAGISRHMPTGPSNAPAPARFHPIGRRPVVPSAEEIARNPRSRSARLRGAERTDAPAAQTGAWS